MPTTPTTPQEVARTHNSRLVTSIEKRAASPNTVLGPCLASYNEWLESGPTESPLHDLTRHLVNTLPETRQSIQQRMTAKWEAKGGTAEDTAGSVTNSLRRSAGTNYQALVSYAIAKYLLAHESLWYVVHPVPRGFGNTLAIRFTGGVPRAGDSEPRDAGDVVDTPYPPSDDPSSAAKTAAHSSENADDANVTVKPDLDILIRHAAWETDRTDPEPVLLLSVKTSLADRAGSAARWKTYFDLVTQPCAHICEEDCAYRRLGIELANDPNVSITHGIVTANIYKMTSDPYFTEKGELGTNQARANTFMFDLRYTTRTSGAALVTNGWESLARLPDWLSATSTRYDLPT